MFGFHLDYYICCVICVSGVLINVSGYRRSPSLISIYLLGSTLIVVAGLLFFFTDDRILNDYRGGLDANEQAILFSASTVTAIWLHKTFVALKRHLGII